MAAVTKTCKTCGKEFSYEARRGRPAVYCPECKEKQKAQKAEKKAASKPASQPVAPVETAQAV